MRARQSTPAGWVPPLDPTQRQASEHDKCVAESSNLERGGVAQCEQWNDTHVTRREAPGSGGTGAGHELDVPGVERQPHCDDGERQDKQPGQPGPINV